MNCLIVDDEPLAADLIEDFVSRVPYLNLVNKCRNAFECIENLKINTVDLIFLDIQMPNLSGIQLLKSLDKKPMVIFTTAYSEYAAESYNLDAIDYLLKPFTFERFFKAVNKAYSKHNDSLKSNQITEPIVNEISEKEIEYLFVKSEYKTIKINIKDIEYIEGLKDYVKIYAGSKPILSLLSLKSLEGKLPKENFQRVHRSFIVAIDKIENIQRHRIVIKDNYIPIGDNYKDNFYKSIEKYNI